MPIKFCWLRSSRAMESSWSSCDLLSGATAEDQLLVQFQGMIAEYERAQIAERSRRGKRHRAQQVSINVLGGAPYGYRYMKKTDTTAAYYKVIEAEAEVVSTVFDWYTRTGLSIGAITRELNQQQIPTRSGNERWERSTVWGVLRNPAYAGRACFGKRSGENDGASHGERGNALTIHHARVPARNVPAMNGLRFLCR